MAGGDPERPRAEELRRLLDEVSDGLALVGGGAVRWANTPLARLAGVAQPKDLAGRLVEDLFADAGHGLPRPGAAGALPCRMARPGGEGRPVLVTVLDGAAPPGEVALAVRDASHPLALEEEVLRMGRQLRASNRQLAALQERLQRESAEREELLTVVSHELRTPVTVIAGYNRLLLSGKVGALNERQTHFLAESQKSCQRLNAFIGNLLERARESSCLGPLEVTLAPLADSIEAVVGMLQPLLGDHRLRIEVELDPATPRVRFDPPRIEQVLTNLIGNAIKFTPPGGRIRVATRAARVRGEPWAEVSVADDGPGVRPEDRQRIFEPYVRGAESGEVGGLGLGLAICRRIVEAHGGEIRVTPSAGGGSCFAFTLPAAGDEEAGR